MPVQNGYVPTPAPVADYAAATVFGATRPSDVKDGRLLLPGLGTGNLAAGVRRYTTPGENWNTPQFDYELPDAVGVENDPDRVADLQADRPQLAAGLTIEQSDFLKDPPAGRFEWCLMNPPYTRYNRLDPDAREQYADRFSTAYSRFGLFVPFVEQALDQLAPGGWLTAILPVKLLTRDDCDRVRDLLRRHYVGNVVLLPDETFDEMVVTVMVSVQKQADRTRPTSLWLANLYPFHLTSILEGLGVGDVEAAAAEYRELFESYRETVQMVEQREAGEQADSGRAGAAAADGGVESDQSSLGDWA